MKTFAEYDQERMARWKGDPAILEHFEKWGVLAQAELLMDEDAAGIEEPMICSAELDRILERYS